MDFVPTLPVLLAYALACFILTITPGPDMTLFLGKTVTQGMRAGFAAMLGASTGMIAHTMLAAFGISAVLAASAYAFNVLKVAGALYLLWLAIDAVRNGSVLRLARGAERPQPLARVYATGVGINLLNPKIILFFVTFLPQFVSASDPQAQAKLIFLGFFFIAFALPLTSAMILMTGQISEMLRRNPKIMRALDWLFAGVFGAFAVKMLLTRAS